MIPTMILFGLAFGRWWRAALIGSAAFMPALALLGGAIETPREVVVAGVLGVVNAAVGVAVHQAILQAYRRWA